MKSWLLVSLAVGIALQLRRDFSLAALGGSALIAGSTVGLGIIVHELAHKWFAERAGARAEFIANDPALLTGLVLSLFGFLFAAPGAVRIHHLSDHEKRGHIALAGPLSNLVLALVFFALWMSNPFPVLSGLLGFGASINALLAVFNLLPLGPFDGAKVIAWSTSWYLGSVAACIAVLALLLANGLWL